MSTLSAGDLERLRQDAVTLLPRMTQWRQQLHRHPEVGLELPRTQQLVLDALADLDLEIRPGDGLSSVTAVLHGEQAGPAVLLRGDMDALPVQEETGEEFGSEIPGVMHACGHDLHTAGLLGAARLLAARRSELAGSVVFMFQPGEEGDGGARLMIDQGVLEAAGPRVVSAYALHVLSAVVPSGAVITRPGVILAAADNVTVTVNGRGGHGSMPHLAADPVPVAAEIVLALETVVSRQFDVFDPVVISVGRIAAGSSSNVIPSTATIEMTVRTLSEHTHATVHQAVARACEHVALAHGMTATVAYETGYPVTVNDAAEVDRVARIAPPLTAAGYHPAPQPIPGAEDFSYVLEQVPGAFVGLGATPPEVEPSVAPYNHSGHARFDGRSMAVGAALLAGLAWDRLVQG
jgi:amidohydrolase